MPDIRFDPAVGELILTYARRVVARGYIHNSLGNIAIRVPHPGFEHGVVYTKHAEVSLEEMTVENDVGPIAEFIAGTNSILMENHGVTTLGRTISEAFHRLNTLSSEIRRVILAEQLAALRGEEVHYLAPDAVEWMYRYAESVIY